MIYYATELMGAFLKAFLCDPDANGRVFEGFCMRRYAFVGMIYYATKLMGAFWRISDEVYASDLIHETSLLVRL
jgi:hypothetical protein